MICSLGRVGPGADHYHADAGRRVDDSRFAGALNIMHTGTLLELGLDSANACPGARALGSYTSATRVLYILGASASLGARRVIVARDNVQMFDIRT